MSCKDRHQCRLAQFFEEAEIEYSRQRQLLENAFLNGDIESVLTLMEDRSERYTAAVDRLLREGRNAASRSYSKLHGVINLVNLSQQLKQLDDVFIPPTSYRQKRRSSIFDRLSHLNSNSDFSSAVTPYNDCLKKIADLKMTPKLASAASRFQCELAKSSSVKSSVHVLSLADVDESVPETEEDDKDEMQDETEPSSQIRSLRMGSQNSLAPTSITVQVNGPARIEQIPKLEPLAKYNCETILEENHSHDPGSNMLLNMIKSPLLKIQEKFGLVSLKKPCPPTPKTPYQQVRSWHRKLKPLPPKVTCLRPDQDELVVYADIRVNQLAPWAGSAHFRTAVEQQRDWNPYSLFGIGVRVIAYEEVFKTPDFRAMARNAASELRSGLSHNRVHGRETRIERWYRDANGYNTGEGMTLKQLEYMVKAMKKKTDISHLAYEDHWTPCDDVCSHSASQPWVKRDLL